MESAVFIKGNEVPGPGVFRPVEELALGTLRSAGTVPRPGRDEIPCDRSVRRQQRAASQALHELASLHGAASPTSVKGSMRVKFQGCAGGDCSADQVNPRTRFLRRW